MPATLIMPDGLMKNVQELANQKSKTKEIAAAMESFVKLKGRENLRALRGKVDIDRDREREEAA